MIQEPVAECPGSSPFPRDRSCAILWISWTKEKFLSFIFIFFLVILQVALWTEVAHQEVREVSETAQGKRWYCTFQDFFFFQSQGWNIFMFLFSFKYVFQWLTVIGESVKILLWKFWFFSLCLMFWSCWCEFAASLTESVWLWINQITGEALRWIFWVTGNVGEVIWKEWPVVTPGAVQTLSSSGIGAVCCPCAPVPALRPFPSSVFLLVLECSRPRGNSHVALGPTFSLWITGCKGWTNTLLMTCWTAVVTSKGCAIIQVPCGTCFLHRADPCCWCCSSDKAQSGATVVADYWILCLKKLSAVLADECLACGFHTLRAGQFNILLHC